MVERYSAFHLGKTLFERLQEGVGIELLLPIVVWVRSERRALAIHRAQAMSARLAAPEVVDAAEAILRVAIGSFARGAARINAAHLQERQFTEHEATCLLLNAALLGVEMECNPAAGTILDAIMQRRPHLAIARLLHAHLLCRTSRGYEGRHALLQLVEDFPEFHPARAVLALEDRQTNRPGWRGLAEAIEAQDADGTSKQVAAFVLDRSVSVAQSSHISGQ